MDTNYITHHSADEDPLTNDGHDPIVPPSATPESASAGSHDDTIESDEDENPTSALENMAELPLHVVGCNDDKSTNLVAKALVDDDVPESAMRAPGDGANEAKPIEPDVDDSVLAPDNPPPASAPLNAALPTDTLEEVQITSSPSDGAVKTVEDARSYPLRPVPLLVNFGNIPPEIRGRRHFVVWKFELRGGKWTKAPYQPNGRRASVTDSNTWSTFEEVEAAFLAGGFDGIGLVLTHELGLVAIDLDHQLVDGKWSEAAQSVIKSVNSYSEFSPSGDGIRILAFGKLPTDEVKNGDFENFEDKHYVTLTGQRISDTPETIERRQEEVAAYHKQYVVKARKPGVGPKKSTARVNGSPLTKEQVLEKAARNSNGAKFIDFYRNGENSPLSPKRGDGSVDRSVMDLFVCGVLAHFTGGNKELMDEMMRESALMRPKWDERHSGDGSTYGEMTIGKAVDGCHQFYDPLAPEFAPLTVGDIPVAKGMGRNNAPIYGPRQILELLYPDWNVQAIDTEAAHARRIAHYLSGELCHVDGLGWLRYNGRHWDVDNRGHKRVLVRVAELSKYVRAEATRLYELTPLLSGAGRGGDAAAMGDAAKTLSTLARTVERKRFIADSIELAAGRPEISRSIRQFEPKEWQITFANCVWDQGVLRDHRREDCVLHPCPVEVDADRLALLEEQTCAALEGDPEADVALGPWKDTEWGDVLKRMTGGDADLARTLQEIAGYVLSAAPYLRIVVWAYGDRGTGKGTYTELLKTVLGDNAVALDPKSLSPRGDRERLGARLAHKRFGVCAEAGNKQFDAELLKTHSGADTMSARRLFNEAFDADPHHVLCLVSNHAPRMEAHDEALKERIVVLPFTHPMDEGGTLFLTGGLRLEQVRRQADSPLVLEFVIWALLGAQRVMETGKVFRAPEVESAIEKFWKDTDRMRRFWETVPLAKLDRGIFGNELRELYHYWCEGMRVLPQYRLSEGELRKAFLGIGLIEARVGAKSVRGYRLSRDPHRVCSREETNPATGKKMVIELNIYGEPVANGDSAGQSGFRQEDFKEKELKAYFDAMLDGHEPVEEDGQLELEFEFEECPIYSESKFREGELDLHIESLFGPSQRTEDGKPAMKVEDFIGNSERARKNVDL